MGRELQRKTPDELLRQVEAEEAAVTRRGHLKIFLGYASGVGKTVRMLAEARRRRERGQDIVIGAVQPRAPAEAAELLKHLEVVPLKSVAEGSTIDVEAIIRRRPAICIIDGLAYDNPPGSRNTARWQDVQELVAAGIKVIGSINLQYVEELREEVEAITGKHVEQTVPVSFIKSADEIEIVDAPAENSSGTSPEANKLSKLREMALVLAADVVDHQLAGYLTAQGIYQQFGGHERILVCLTPRANVGEMLETAQTIAERFHGELIAAYVNQPQLSEADQATLDQKLAMAQAAGARVEILEGADPIHTLLEFARSSGITQLFVGHSQRKGMWSRLWGSPVDQLVRLSQGMDVRVFPQ